jgi:dihydroorotate dehydrogenase (NAD+) catalytic subunit
MPSLDIVVGGVAMKNPVAVASGTAGYGDVFTRSYHPASLGALVTKGISLEPRQGNPAPRMAETPAGMINAIGLENVGLQAFLADKLPPLREAKVTTVVNILGNSIADYILLAEALSVPGVHGLELNISCPNVKSGGIIFGSSPRVAAELVDAVRHHTRLPLWVKLSPNVADIAEMARAVESAGADAVSLVNTFRAMAIDVKHRKPVLASVIGGLSGPAIKPIALRMVFETARAVKIPVVGIGGITEPDDALEFILAGATAIQVGTANFLDPQTPLRIITGIQKYLTDNGISHIRELVGAIELPAR